MSITLKCSGCGKEYRVSDDKAGKRVRCKKCQAVIAIPVPEAEDDWEEDFSDAGGDVNSDDEYGAAVTARRRSTTGRAAVSRARSRRSSQAEKNAGSDKNRLIPLISALAFVALCAVAYFGINAALNRNADQRKQAAMAESERITELSRAAGFDDAAEEANRRDAARSAPSGPKPGETPADCEPLLMYEVLYETEPDSGPKTSQLRTHLSAWEFPWNETNSKTRSRLRGYDIIADPVELNWQGEKVLGEMQIWNRDLNKQEKLSQRYQKATFWRSDDIPLPEYVIHLSHTAFIRVPSGTIRFEVEPLDSAPKKKQPFFKMKSQYKQPVKYPADERELDAHLFEYTAETGVGDRRGTQGEQSKQVGTYTVSADVEFGICAREAKVSGSSESGRVSFAVKSITPAGPGSDFQLIRDAGFGFAPPPGFQPVSAGEEEICRFRNSTGMTIAVEFLQIAEESLVEWYRENVVFPKLRIATPDFVSDVIGAGHHIAGRRLVSYRTPDRGTRTLVTKNRGQGYKITMTGVAGLDFYESWDLLLGWRWMTNPVIRRPGVLTIAPHFSIPHRTKYQLVKSLSFSPDGLLLAYVTNYYNIDRHISDLQIAVWDVHNERRVASKEDKWGRHHFISFLPDGSSLLTDGRNGDLAFWDPKTLEEKQVVPFQLQRGGVVSPDGRWIGNASQVYGVHLFDLQTGDTKELQPKDEEHNYRVSGIFFSDGSTFYAGIAEKFRAWDVQSGRLKFDRDVFLGDVSVKLNRAALAPDDRRLMCLGDRGKLWAWDLKTNKMLWQMDLVAKHRSWLISEAVLSPDGRWIAYCHLSDNNVTIREMRTGVLRALLIGTPDARDWRTSNPQIAFSPDGRTVASNAGDQRVKLWDISALTDD